jgi:polynucleotide 5'-hydroxyl-kinase GRC3/NOL9
LQAIAALPAGSLVLLLGGADTGKTTFARQAINFLAGEKGLPVGLVDADIGQSEIGPPGTIGAAAARPGDNRLPLVSLHALPLLDAAFVGATAPPGHLLSILSGVVRMANTAGRTLCGEGRVLIDTPGYIAGPAARALVHAIAQALDPALILGFDRAGELSPILELFAYLSPPPVLAVIRPSAEIGRKSTSVRAARRAARLVHFLNGAVPLAVPWDSVDLVNSSLGAGAPLAPHLLKFIGNMLGSSCLYAQRQPDSALYAIVERTPAKTAGIGAIEEQFETRHITVVPQSHFEGLVCGLSDAHRRFLGVGLIEQVDYLHREFSILTCVRRREAIAQMALGAFRARLDGREIGHIRPGSV